jgi:death-on-curing protein
VSIEYVRADVLRNVQGRIIETYGGLPGIRDQSAFESAMARPRNLAAYEDIDSIAVLGACVSWALIKSHAFKDGNKRAGFAALVMFLELNGHRITCAEVEETAMTLRAAASEINEEAWTAWAESVVEPVG